MTLIVVPGKDVAEKGQGIETLGTPQGGLDDVHLVYFRGTAVPKGHYGQSEQEHASLFLQTRGCMVSPFPVG